MVETTWQTDTGWIIVRDALVMGPWHNTEERSRTHRRTPSDWDAEHILHRPVRCVSGTVELELSCEPAFDYYPKDTAWEYSGSDYGAATATCVSGAAEKGEHPTLKLTTNLRLGLEGREARAHRPLKEGEDVYVAMSWASLPAPQDFEEAASKMWDTAECWRQWIVNGRFSRCGASTPWVWNGRPTTSLLSSRTCPARRTGQSIPCR